MNLKKRKKNCILIKLNVKETWRMSVIDFTANKSGNENKTERRSQG